ncbi:MAG: threonine/serine exporter ThrE family protein [Suipraeoptans sp.]
MNKKRLIKEKFDLTVDVGEIIIANGGEIFRAHDTMLRLAEYFQLEHFDTYIVANGIFTSITIDEKYYSCQIRYTSLGNINLSRVEAVNTLSRNLENNAFTIQELREQIDAIRILNPSKDWLKILVAGISSGAFCFLFRGSPLDSLAATIAGLIMYAFLQKVLDNVNFPKMMDVIISSALAAGCCAIFLKLGLGDDLNHMIIGAIFPLVPGVSFTNGIRNLMNYEHLTGVIRLTDAIITATGTVIGVGIVLTLL